MNFCIDEQLGGVARVQFFLLTETGNWPVVLHDTNAGQITFNPEENNVEGRIVKDSFAINDKPQNNVWPISIAFTYLARAEALEQLLEQYARKPGIVRVWFNDGTQKIYGTNLEPLYLNWNNDYGTRATDMHGANITITGTTSHRPVYYTAP